MDMFVLCAVAVLAAMGGFWAGRSIQWQLVEEESTETENVEEKGSSRIKTIARGREIGSPVTGDAGVFQENGRLKVRIQPEQGKVYAPVSGKISHLYPMGSAMRMQTEFGAEIFLQVGSHVDEMCSGFYRCRVMEHEYVRKGALLMEYDPEGIEEQGADSTVILSVENEEELGGMSAAEQGRVKAGEPVLCVAGNLHAKSGQSNLSIS